MEEYIVKPIDKEKLKRAVSMGLEHIWDIPGSKSITNRALVLAALISGTTRLNGVLHSDDTMHMINALKAFGIVITEDGPTTLIVHGGVEKLKPVKDNQPIFIGNSGTTVRFLATFCCLVPGEVTLVGDEAMSKRPIEDLVDGLQQIGVDIVCHNNNGCPPLTIKSNGLRGGKVSMKGSKSSQYFTSVMLSAPLADEDFEISIIDKLVSAPYVEMTARMMQAFGAEVKLHYSGLGADKENIIKITVKAKPFSCPFNEVFVYNIEADASAASYAFEAAAATGVTVKVSHKINIPGKSLGLKSFDEDVVKQNTLQGDWAFVDILKGMGCKVIKDSEYITVTGPRTQSHPGVILKGVDVDMFHISDTVMSLAALAPICNSHVHIKNIANIRIKEYHIFSFSTRNLLNSYPVSKTLKA